MTEMGITTARLTGCLAHDTDFANLRRLHAEPTVMAWLALANARSCKI